MLETVTNAKLAQLVNSQIIPGLTALHQDQFANVMRSSMPQTDVRLAH